MKAKEKLSHFQRKVRKPSPMPFLAAGGALVPVGWSSEISSLWDYIKLCFAGLAVFWIARLIWPGKKVVIDLPPDTGDAQCDALLTEAREALAAIRKANDDIADAGISACIEGIDSSCRAILNRLEEQPALHSQLRTFLRYYLPTTRKLLEARAQIERGGEQGDNARKVRERTDRVLPEIRRAFSRQLEALDKHRYLDLQVEMDVLEGMLKSDDIGGADGGQTAGS